MFKIIGLDHIVLRAKEIQSMISFYRDVLGCSVARTNDGIGLYQLRAGSSLIDIIDVQGPLGKEGGAAPASDAHNMDHFCIRLEVFDEEKIRLHLNANSVNFSEIADRYGADGVGQSIYIKDPEGNKIELKGPPHIEKSSQSK